MRKPVIAMIAAAVLALPALAQTAAVPTNPTGASTSGTSSGGVASPATANTLITANGDLRASRIVGAAVYNDHDQKVGSIEELLIGSNHSLSAVVSVGGFLGLGSKSVQVPFDKLQFGTATSSRVIMPGVTKDSLSTMPDFHFNDQG